VTHVCNTCETQIVGKRYKCTDSACQDFDLCERCYGFKNEVHSPIHQFIELNPVTSSNNCSQYRGRCQWRRQCGNNTVKTSQCGKSVQKEVSKVEIQPTAPVTLDSEDEETEIKVVQPSSNSFEKNLKQMQDMGFPDRTRNIEALVKNNGDVVLAVQALL